MFRSHFGSREFCSGLTKHSFVGVTHLILRLVQIPSWFCKLADIEALTLFSFVKTEPSWHRNQRKKRQLARGVLAAVRLGVVIDNHIASSAFHRLNNHHGSAVGKVVGSTSSMSIRGSDAHWQCRLCKTKGEPTFNFGHRTSCFGCKVDKGKCHGGPAKDRRAQNAAKAQSSLPSLAERQVACQKQHEAAERNKKLAKQNKELLAKVKRVEEKLVKAEGATGQASAGDSSDAAADCQEGPAGINYRMEIQAVHERIKFFESPSQRNRSDSAKFLAEEKQKLTMLEKEAMDSKPVCEQVRKAHRAVEQCSRAKEKLEKENGDVMDKIAELQETSRAIRLAIAKADVDLAEAKQKLDLIHKKHIVPPHGSAADAAPPMDPAALCSQMQQLVQLLSGQEIFSADAPHLQALDGALDKIKEFYSKGRPQQVSTHEAERLECLRLQQDLDNQAAAFAEAEAHQRAQNQQEPIPQLPCKAGAGAGAQLAVRANEGGSDDFMDDDASAGGASAGILEAIAKLQPQERENIAKRLRCA